MVFEIFLKRNLRDIFLGVVGGMTVALLIRTSDLTDSVFVGSIMGLIIAIIVIFIALIFSLIDWREYQRKKN